MKKNHVNILKLTIPVFLACVCFLIALSKNNQATMPVSLSLEIEGQYSYDNENWYPILKDTCFSDSEKELWLKLDFDVNEYTMGRLNFYRDHIGVSIYIENELVYMDAQTEVMQMRNQLFPTMCSRTWDCWLVDGQTDAKEITIRLFDFHEHGNNRAYQNFIDSLCISANTDLILENELSSYVKPAVALGSAIVFVSVMLLGASLAALVLKSSNAFEWFRMGLLTLFVGGYIYLDTMIVSTDEIVVVKTYGGIICNILAIYVLNVMVQVSMQGTKRRIADILAWTSCFVNCVLLLMVTFGEMLILDMQFYWSVMQFIVSIVLLGLCVHKWLECDRGEIEKRIAFIALQIALILDFFEVGHRMVYPRPIFKIVFMVVLVFYLFNGARVAVMNNQAALKNKKLEKELENSRISVMLSQIQPHFLYNSLTSVMDLCDSNPKEAKRAIADFADYLRGNLNSLKTQTPIPFSKEFEHIQKYLKLEKLRFKEELEIEYDIETVDFMLPALSVQPLVENAVKHGVGACPGGGKVRICTEETATEYVVIIEDNGIGFDLNAIKEDGKTHVGLENIQNRLSMMMNAKLEIESQIDVGTVARVIIHKGDN